MTKRMRNFTVTILSALAACLLFFGAVLLLPAPREAGAVTVTSLPAGLEDLFTDYTWTRLGEGYDGDALESLKAEYRDNSQALSVLSRAEQVLRGEVRFQPSREFSTEGDAFGKIGQYGDVSAYSDTTLKWKYDASDLLITGIYATAGDTFTVYVDAAEGCPLPQIVYTRHHGTYRNYRSTVRLDRGANTFSAESFASGSAGPVYIRNLYLPEQQPGGVRLYIEGGDFYPVFEKGGDVTAFLGDLKAYEEKRLRSGGEIPDLAELSTDYAFFTTTSSSLYEAYITRNIIDPQENMDLWGDFFAQMYEFNGIPTSENSPYGTYDPRVKGVRLNFRYMEAIAGSGAYATAYHIGVYRDHLGWLADYKDATEGGMGTTGDYVVFSLGHEIGHMLDTDGRRLDETTNNMSGAYAYQIVMGKCPPATYQPYGTSLELLARDGPNTKDAYREVHILYQGNNGIYDRNYMVWWFLECRYPGYWAKLNALYREDKGSTLYNSNERLVYLSSLATGADLGSYFDRWGMFVSGSPFSLDGATETYHSLMREAKSGDVKEVFDRFYYADEAEYGFIRATAREDTAYEGGISALSVKNSSDGRIVTVAGKQDPAHLGYEIRVSTDGERYTTAGFTRSAQFSDSFAYPSEPYYKAVAVNRFFQTSEESAPVRADNAQVLSGVCRVGEERFDSLKEGIGNAAAGGTVYLLADCSLDGLDRYSPLTLEVDPEVHENVRISNTGNSFLFKSDAAVTFRGHEDAHIVIDNGPVSRFYPPIFVGSGAFTAEYTDFSGISSKLGGAIYAVSNDLTLKHCTFENCTGGNADFIDMGGRHTLTLFDCTFSGTGRDIRLSAGSTLLLSGSIPKLKLFLDGDAEIRTDFDPTEEQLRALDGGDGLRATVQERKICFVSAKRKLTFRSGAGETVFETGETFVFGQEHAALGKDEYIEGYVDADTLEEYHAGDVIHPAEDRTFDVRTAKKTGVVLRFKSGGKEFFLAPSERVYLPRTDGTEHIAYWLADGEIIPAGGSCGIAERIFPVYAGYLFYEFYRGEEWLSAGYARYGESVSLPELGEFDAWLLHGKKVEGDVRLTSDGVFFAVREEEVLPDLSNAQISLVGGTPVYNGEAQTPGVVLTLGEEILSPALYELVYSDNVDAGEFTVTARAAENARAVGSVSAVFSILPRDISEEASAEQPEDVVYTGEEQKRTPAVRWNKRLLGEGEVSFSWQGDLKNAGTVTVTAEFSGNFTGSVSTAYRILKADHPLLPASEMKAENEKQLCELPLPAGWEWEDGTRSVVGEGTFSAKAVYRGEDAENYLVTEAFVEIECAAPEIPPVDPEGPEEPKDPEEPEDPDEPKDPEEPDEPEEPKDPEEPEDPDEPKEPETPPAESGCGGTASPFFLLLFVLPFLKKRKRMGDFGQNSVK